VRSELYARNKHEGWESDAVKQSQNTQEGQGDASTDLDVVLVVSDAINKDKTPQYNQSFDAVRESVSLEGPSSVGRRDESDGNPPLSRRMDELMDSPVLEYKAQQEHHDPQSVKGDSGGHLAITQAFPKPFKDCERHAIDQPEWKEAPDGRG